MLNQPLESCCHAIQPETRPGGPVLMYTEAQYPV